MPMGSHFWTTDAGSAGLPQSDWARDGEVFCVWSGPMDQVPASAVPLFHFHDTAGERHLWTLDAEGEALPKSEFRREKIVGYVFPTAQPGTVPLYRWYSSHEDRHFWTTDAQGEHMPRPPYRLEAAVCHVWPAGSHEAGMTPVFRWHRTVGMHVWQIEVYRLVVEATGPTARQIVIRRSIDANDWPDALAKANQMFRQHQPADGYHLIDGRCTNPV